MTLCFVMLYNGAGLQTMIRCCLCCLCGSLLESISAIL